MLTLKSHNFDGTRLLDSRNVLTTFYAEWCPFGRSFVTLFKKAMEHQKDPLGALVDISDTDDPLWETFEVKIVPTLVGFRNGEAVVRRDGVAGVGLGVSELEEALRIMKEVTT